MMSSLEHHYGIDGSYFLSGFFFGEMLDPIMGGEGATTKLVFQTVRLESWSAGRMLMSSGKYQETLDMMFASWRTKEKLLDEFVRNGLMD